MAYTAEPEVGDGSSATTEAIGFITEFNENARIFNEQLAPLLNSLGVSSETTEDGEQETFEGVSSGYTQKWTFGDLHLLR